MSGSAEREVCFARHDADELGRKEILTRALITRIHHRPHNDSQGERAKYDVCDDVSFSRHGVGFLLEPLSVKQA
jgi:hypothetical protein